MGGGQSRPARPRKVCIIGGGAAGMACAWSLSRHPDKFDVHLWESLPQVGGVASTCEVAPGVEVNDQVQGGAPSYRNNLLFFKEFGFEPHPVELRVAFGTGDSAWTNHSDSKLVRRLQPEIERFGRVLKWVHRLEPIFIFVPINKVLRWWGFSSAFATEMVFPLTALFFGTGNQTPHVSAAVIARVFLDPQLRLFQYSPKRLLDDVPTMFAFPKLGEVFGKMAKSINATVRTDARVERVLRRQAGKGGRQHGAVVVVDSQGHSEEFDEVVFCCGTEEALRMLDKPSWLERRLLANVEYFNDLIVTHQDEEYMRREKIEMSFRLNSYQPHLAGKAPSTQWQGTIYQSIFLDDQQSQKWTVGEIDKSKVRFLQGKQHTWYAGSYTLFNTHEIAVMSGLAVAERLGAPYPFPEDQLAREQFATYLKLAHGLFARRKQHAT
ncbi:hypothetical protein N2152v2_008648 [Parachlorella kessleri]